jgi:nucleoside-diphosphate-sugar epimerase
MIFVFGGAGFIGRGIVKRLLDEGKQVVVVDNLVVEPVDPVDERAIFIRGDVRRRHDIMMNVPLRQFLTQDHIETIYWLPAKQGYSEDWSTFGTVNIASAYLLFESLNSIRKQVGRIVLSSSQAIYSPGLKVSEEHPKEAASVYGQTKWFQEQAFFQLARSLSIQLVALRYSIVLGAGQSTQSSESGILRNWYRRCKRGELPEVYGRGKQVRDFVHVEDVVEANLLAARTPLPEDMSQVALNVGGYPASVMQMAQLFGEITTWTKFHSVGERRPGGEFSLTSSSDRAKQYLGWEPRLSLSRQVRDFVEGCKRLGKL